MKHKPNNRSLIDELNLVGNPKNSKGKARLLEVSRPWTAKTAQPAGCAVKLGVEEGCLAT